MTWIMVVMVYVAPAGPVDWDGPWKLGLTEVNDTHYASEAECRTAAIRLIGKMHDGMLAPIRYRCIGVETNLAKGAPR